MMQEVFVGVDVAKGWLDIHHPGRGARRIDDTPTAARAFAAACGPGRAHGSSSRRAAARTRWLARGARGGRGPRSAARTRGPGARLRPGHGRVRPKLTGPVRACSRSSAPVLAPCRRSRWRRCGVPSRHRPPATDSSWRCASRRPRACSKRPTSRRAPCIRGVVATLKRRIAKIEARMAELVATDPEMATLDRRLRTAPGVGPVAAATLIAEMSELGQRDRRHIAAASPPSRARPPSRDSGTRMGRRVIGGGRPVARMMLTIAALHASRCDDVSGAFRRLCDVTDGMRAARRSG